MTESWIVPQLWAGDPAVCIGGGPSLTQRQVDYVKGKAKVIAINDAYRVAPWADVLYACDLKWWDWHYPAIGDFKGLKITQDPLAKKKYHDLIWIKGNTEPGGFSIDSNEIKTGMNSGYQAANLAMLLGATPIILIGYDHRFPGNQAHWFGDHPDKVRSCYSRWFKLWETVPEQIKKMGVKIINCTPGSALKVFPMAQLEDTL